jgi:hypothetical protein
VRGIAERTEICVVWRDDDGASAGREQPMELFDGANDVGDMFNDVDGSDFLNGLIAQRPWEAVEIGDHIGAGVCVAIQANGARIFINAAADVENRKRCERARWVRLGSQPLRRCCSSLCRRVS